MNESKEQLETLLSDYVDGNLTGAQLASVESYLDANPGVRDAVNRLMIDSEALRSLPRVTAPFDFSEDVRGQLERDLLLDGTQVSFPRRRRISSFVMTAAAMLILFVGIGGGAYWILSNRPAPFLDVAMNSSTGPAGEVDRAAKPEEASPKSEESGRTKSEMAARSDTEADSATKTLALNEATANPPAAIAAPVPSQEGFVVRSNDEMMKSVAMRRASFAKQAPADVVQLVDEAPRYNRRAVAIVIDAKDAVPAKAAVNDYLAFNSVRSQALAYDATRNRALRPEREGLEAVADSSSQQVAGSQVSGVITNSAESPVVQAMGGATFAGGLPSQPQVVLAIGLTDTQVDDLHSTLLKDIGSDHAQAFELGEADSLRLLQSATADLSKVSEAGKGAPAAADDKNIPTSQPAVLAAGDALVVTLIDPDASNLKTQRNVTIDASGTIELPQLEKVHAAGMTLQALRESIVSQYIDRKLMRDPLVNIELVSAANGSPKKVEDKDVAVPIPGSKYGDKDVVAGGEAQAAQKSKDDVVTADLLDVFIVVRGEPSAIVTLPTTQPAAPAETPTPTTTTQPTQPQ